MAYKMIVADGGGGMVEGERKYPLYKDDIHRSLSCRLKE
jgi:hypothetical protein